MLGSQGDNDNVHILDKIQQFIGYTNICTRNGLQPISSYLAQRFIFWKTTIINSTKQILFTALAIFLAP